MYDHELDIIKRFDAKVPGNKELARQCALDSSRKGGKNWGKTTFVYQVGREYVVTRERWLAHEVGRTVLAQTWGWMAA